MEQQPAKEETLSGGGGRIGLGGLVWKMWLGDLDGMEPTIQDKADSLRQIGRPRLGSQRGSWLTNALYYARMYVQSMCNL